MEPSLPIQYLEEWSGSGFSDESLVIRPMDCGGQIMQIAEHQPLTGNRGKIEPRWRRGVRVCGIQTGVETHRASTTAWPSVQYDFSAKHANPECCCENCVPNLQISFYHWRVRRDFLIVHLMQRV